ncbi:MAG: hypothetical protein M3505_01830 [Verrucomicrobiota bacterium]|nr:hypothetical protein [Chthoniobacterales bacterium]MDQ3313369.1 hypothetical protein [Verrucomicrobiota bacterium]
MRLAVILLGCWIGFTTLGAARPQTEIEVAPVTGDPKVYGEYPMAYKEIIQRWLETKLADAPSAVLDWTDAPKPGEYKTQKGQRFIGYVVDFKVNARNQFGAPTGKQKYRVVIRNGDVLWGGRPRY